MKLLILLVLVASAYANVSPEYATLVKGSWDQVKKSEADILYFIFKENPDIQAKFSMFAGKDLESLKSTAPFALHATRIVSLINNFVLLLGKESNNGATESLFSEMAGNHKPRNVPMSQFTEFRASFMKYMAAHSTYGDNVSNAWSAAWDYWFTVLAKYY